MNKRPENPREFAVHVAERLREAGFETLWAGGCVRDQLLGIEPKDYDVATSATPEEVIDLFGKRRTVPVGISFGVVMVLGPSRNCGQVEVATFRADGEYLDGRHPDSVQFCSAEEDAKRRDFTINGMFYDPIADQVIDYVGGQDDLTSQVVRAIGSAANRFSEDKLRMLRAVRFAATFDFEIEPETADAIRDTASDINQVSVERIAQELRRMFSASSRAKALRDLIQLQLLPNVFPQLSPDGFERAVPVAERLSLAKFEPTLAGLFMELFDSTGATARDRCVEVRQECRKLKLSNEEADTTCWLINALWSSSGAAELPLHQLKPTLADLRAELLLDLVQAVSVLQPDRLDDYTFLHSFRENHSHEQLSPKPFVDGSDLKELGVDPGPQFKTILNQIRDEQLDEKLSSREMALQRVSQLLTMDGE